LEALEPRWTPSVSFDSFVSFSANNPENEVVADFNGDGKPDLTVSEAGSFLFGGAHVAVLLNTTTAGMSVPSLGPEQTVLSANAGSIAAADFNGDGRPDLAIVSGSSVTILLNTTPTGSATVSFTAPQTFAVGQVGHSSGQLVVADVNGDGKPDLAVVDSTDNMVSVLLNTTATGAGTASFAAQQTFPVGGDPVALTAADLNGDGKPDLAVTNFTDKTLSVLVNTTPTGGGTASFAAQQSFAVGSNPNAVAATDLNGDGKPDLAVTNLMDRTVSVLMNTTATGSGSAAFATQQTFALGFDPSDVTTADLNGDGKPDLAVTNGSSPGVGVLINSTPTGAGTASFAPPQTFAAPQSNASGILGGTGSSASVVAADLNGDGLPDLITGNPLSGKGGGGTVSVLLNTSLSAVLGQFGADGVWEYNGTTGAWKQLTPANASLLASDPLGDVAAEFHGFGVWEYTNSGGWRMLNGIDATALTIGPNGQIAANFPGYGVGEYQPGVGWTSLTAASASLLAMDSIGDVAGAFPGHGVWVYSPASGWKQLNGVDATALAMDAAGDLAANFPGYGVGEYTTSNNSWAIINGVQAQALAMDAQGDIAAQFAGYGVGQFTPGTGWHLLTAANASLLAADDGAIVGAFHGHGVWEFDPTRGWFQLTAAEATALAMA
jgi:hypothetical protein